MSQKKKKLSPVVSVQPGPQKSMLSHLYLPLVALLSFGCFFSSIFFDFLNWDDQVYILNNPLVQQLNWHNIREIFTTTFDGHYHPLILLSFSIDHAIAGNSSWFFHLVNVLLHTLNACLVFLIIRRLFSNPLAAFLASLLWALHPLMVESVAWITARKDVLYGFFYLYSLYSYIKYIESSRKKHFFVSLVLLVLSALSKEQAAFLAPSLVLVDYLKGRKLLQKKVILEKIPYFVFALLAGAAAIIAQKETGYIKPLSGETVSLANRLVLGSHGLVMYLFKWLVPVNLSAYYPYPFDSLKPAPGIFWISAAIIPALLFLMFYLPRKSKALAFGLWFFMVNIFVMLRLLHANPGDFYIADRYMYIASFGLVFILAAAVSRKPDAERKPGPALKVASLLLILIYTGFTLIRVNVWKDSLTLLNDILKKHPNAYTALNCRGDLYLESGNLKGALADFNKAVSLNSANDRAFANRGRARAMNGDTEGGLEDLNRAVALNPRDPANFINRGIAKELSGDLKGALADMNSALKLSPENPLALTNRGNVYVHAGEFSKAINDYNKVILMIPDRGIAYAGRGTAKSNLNDPQGALKDFDAAVSLGYDVPAVYYQRGLTYYRMQKFNEALGDFIRVTQQQPENALAWAYKGFANYNLAKYSEAVADLDQSLTLSPGFDLAYAMRGMSYLRMGNSREACSDLRLAANLGNRAAAAEYSRQCGN